MELLEAHHFEIYSVDGILYSSIVAAAAPATVATTTITTAIQCIV